MNRTIFSNGKEIDLQVPYGCAFHGASVFTTFRIKNGQAIWLQEHIERLKRHAKKVGIKFPKTAKFQRALSTEKIRGQNLRARFTLTEEALIFETMPYERPSESIYSGTSVSIVITNHQIHPQLGQSKTGNYLPYLLAQKEARMGGVFEGLLVDHNGYVVDGSRTGLLLFRNDCLISLVGGLDSITKIKALCAAKSLGLAVQHKKLKARQLNGQLLLASSLMGLIPVGKPQATAIYRLIEAFRPE